MGRTYRKKSEFARGKDFKKTSKNKNRQSEKEYTRYVYDSLAEDKSETEEVKNYIEDQEIEQEIMIYQVKMLHMIHYPMNKQIQFLHL